MGIDPLYEYKHILEAIRATWSYPECASYIDRLLLQERGETRHGLHVEALETLTVILDLHDFLYPRKQTPQTDKWGD